MTKHKTDTCRCPTCMEIRCVPPADGSLLPATITAAVIAGLFALWLSSCTPDPGPTWRKSCRKACLPHLARYYTSHDGDPVCVCDESVQVREIK